MKKNKTKKRVAAIFALVALLAAMVGATFAWIDYDQHKSNEFNGRGYHHDVRLIDDFDEVDDWRIDDGPISKEIRVANVALASDAFGPVIVRLQLKEYMEIGELSYTMTDKRYMIDTNGRFVVFTSEDAAKLAWPGHNVAQLTDVVTKATGWFVETQAHDPNGQYGKYVVTDISVNMATATPVIPGTTRHSGDAATAHHDADNDECTYPLHLWDPGSELAYAQYIEWILGANVTALSAWDGVSGSKWVYDDVNGTGWVYWVEFLQPGATTLNLLEAVDLIKQPDGPFYYAIHVDMQAISQDELGRWDDIPPEIRVIFEEPETVGISLNPAGPQTIFVGDIRDLPAATVSPANANQNVTWTSSNPAVVSVDPATGKFRGVAKGTVTLTATAENGARATIRVTVVDDPWELSKDRLEKAVRDGEAITLIDSEKDKWQDAGIADLEGAIADGKPLLPLNKDQVTQKELDDAAQAIEDAIAALVPKVVNTDLPLKPGQPYSPRVDEYDNDNDRRGKLDGWITPDYSSFDVHHNFNEEFYFMYFLLEDILDSSITNYDNITVTNVDSKYNGFFSIDKDHDGKPAIVCEYVPSRQEYIDAGNAAVGGYLRVHPEFTTQITLTQGGRSATFQVILKYFGLIWYMDD